MLRKQKKTRTQKSRLPMRWLMLVGIALLVYSVAGAFINIKLYQVKDRQILFEVVDYCWVGDESGFYIDSEGDVYHFDLREENYFFHLFRSIYFDFRRGSPNFTTEELFRYYGFASKYSHTIPAEELEYMYSLVEAIELGEYIDYDSGIKHTPPSATVYTAFRYARYYPEVVHEPIPVQILGDYPRWSDTPEGEILACWLEEVGFDDPNCTRRKHIIDWYEEIQSWEEDD